MASKATVQKIADRRHGVVNVKVTHTKMLHVGVRIRTAKTNRMVLTEPQKILQMTTRSNERW